MKKLFLSFLILFSLAGCGSITPASPKTFRQYYAYLDATEATIANAVTLYGDPKIAKDVSIKLKLVDTAKVDLLVMNTTNPTTATEKIKVILQTLLDLQTTLQQEGVHF